MPLKKIAYGELVPTFAHLVMGRVAAKNSSFFFFKYFKIPFCCLRIKIKMVKLYSRILKLWNRIILMAKNKSQRSRWYNIKIIIPRYNCLIEFNAIHYTVTTPEVLIHQIKLWCRTNNWKVDWNSVQISLISIDLVDLTIVNSSAE